MSLRIELFLSSYFFLFVEVLGAGAPAMSALPGQYTISLVATNAGVAAAINNFGQVAGSTFSPTGTSVFLWTPLTANGNAGTLIDLGGLPVLAATGSVVNGINNRGQVVGTTSSQSSAVFQVFLWSPTTPNGTAGSVSAPLGNAGSQTFGVGVNDFGQIAANFNLAGNSGAEIWTPSQPNGTSGAVNADSRLTSIVAINNFGQAIVEAYPSALLFTPSVANGSSGTFTPIPGLPLANSTQLIAINGNGTILGTSSCPPDRAAVTITASCGLPSRPMAPRGRRWRSRFRRASRRWTRWRWTRRETYWAERGFPGARSTRRFFIGAGPCTTSPPLRAYRRVRVSPP